jgi:hypothetical protein
MAASSKCGVSRDTGWLTCACSDTATETYCACKNTLEYIQPSSPPDEGAYTGSITTTREKPLIVDFPAYRQRS